MNMEGIALFNDGYLPILDGVSMTVKNYALWLNRKAAPCLVVTPYFPGYTDNDEFRVIRYFSAPLPMRHPYRLGLPALDPSIFNKILDEKLSIVHAHSPFSAGSLALKVARKKKIPVVATFHSKFRDDFEVHIPSKIIVDQMVKQVVKFFEEVDEVWIPQARVEETIRSYGYKGRLEVVENGIDIGTGIDFELFRKESRKALGISETTLVFVFVGQHIWEKNLKFLLEALQKFNGKPFKAIFAGEGYAKPALEKMAAEFGLENKLTFLGSVHDRQQLKRIYASANLFLFPSLYDNAPLVLREAAALQTPALLLKDSTAAEVISDGFNGFLADNSPDAYAKKMAEICANLSLQREAGMRASQTLCRSWENVVVEVIDRYLALINRKAGHKVVGVG